MQLHITDRVLDFAARPLVMGILNVTPDSFSDGGRFFDPDKAVAHALQMIEDGADILDIGGESTRPGSQSVPLDDELARVLPVVKSLAKQTSTPLSIDTSKAEVARQCLDCGAHIINDVTAMTGDANMANVVAASNAAIILMHMQGTPATMQDNPAYDDVVEEVGAYLETQIQFACGNGIARERIAIDPGIGFGKRTHHNMQLLAHLDRLLQMQRPICLGVSRKGFIGKMLGRDDAMDRMIGSVAIACHAAVKKAVQIVRVHDVRETRDAMVMIGALNDQPRDS